VISYHNVTKRYGSVIAVNDVSVEFEPGSVHALLGPNGSGKSTLMKLAIGIVQPDSGKIRLDGIDPSRDPVSARRITSYVPEKIVIYESLTPAETFSFLGSIYELDREKLEERVKLLVRLFKFERQMGKLAGELSHGNRKRLLLISALLHDPKVLIWDEPFSGLDPEAGKVLKEFMRKYALEGKTVVFSTHILELAEAVADVATIMHQGKIVARGSPEELREDLRAIDLESAFLEATGLSAELEELLKVLWGR